MASTILWRESFEIFERLLELPDEAREPELAQLQRTRPDVYPHVVKLLEADSLPGATNFLDGNTPVGDARRDTQIEPVAGAAVGPYQLERPLGAGGMGEVWYARRADGLFEAPVALKLMHAHLAASSIRSRFVREGKILGQLTHPNIAHLLDAGVTAVGQLYLAIEYVEGIAVDRWCNDQKLGVDARVKLFLQICDAVAHAHAHLIVHRDLKPGNILVTPEGSIKLLDFGIAKLVESTDSEAPQTELTRLGGRVLTPEYAAPEQIASQPVTVATDVYSLGVLLYVLLSGKHPYAQPGQSVAQLEQEVLETEPATIGGPLAKSDLAVIVGKALKKKPGDRYASVPALAEDLRRHLEHQPVLAQPDSLAYRAGKFFRRNRIAVLTGAAISLAIVAGIAGTLWQAQRAEQEARRAEARADELKRVVDFQGAMLDRVNVPRFGSDFARLMRERLDRRLASSDSGAPPLKDTLVAIDAAVPYAGLTDVARDTLAEDLLKPAEAQLQRQFGQQPGVESALLNSLGRSYMALSLWDRAEAVFTRAAQLSATDQGPQSAPAEDSRLNRAKALLYLDRLDEARSEAAAVAEVRSRRLGPDHPDTARALSVEAAALKRLGKYGESLGIEQRALSVLRDKLGAQHPDTLDVLGNLGATYLYMEKIPESLAALREAAPAMTRVLGPLHTDTTAVRSNLGFALTEAGKSDEAEAVLASLAGEMSAAYGDDDPNVLIAKANLANAYAANGKVRETMALEKSIIEARLRRYGADNQELLRVQSNYALDLRESGNVKEALKILEDVVGRRQRLLGANHPDTLYTLNNLAVTARADHQLERARALGEEALAGQSRALGLEHRHTVETLDELAVTYDRLGNKARALELGERALAGYRKNLGDAGSETQAQMQRVIAYRRAAGH